MPSTDLPSPTDAALAPGWQQDLRERYASPGRAYHNETHLRAVLAAWATLALEAAWRDPTATWLAAALHDAVYVVGAPDNEARSADLVQPWVARWMRSPVDTAAAQRMILATAGHGASADEAPPDPDTALLLDCDLAILGSSPAHFATYERQVAAEWTPVVGAAAYRDGRRGFLERMLAGPIFHTARFRASHEQAARGNLQRALRQLDRTTT